VYIVPRVVKQIIGKMGTNLCANLVIVTTLLNKNIVAEFSNLP
jgi:hypothetical protein